MLTHFEIDNFKSLVGFSLPLSGFNCVIGQNGAGKTTVLQALDFAAHVMSGEVKEWLDARDWTAADLKNKFSKKRNIELAMTFRMGESTELLWEATFNPQRLACTRELVIQTSAALAKDGEPVRFRVLFELQDGKYCCQRYEDESLELVTPQEILDVGMEVIDLPDPLSLQQYSIPFSYQGSLLSQLKSDGLSGPLQQLKQMVIAIRSLDLLSPEQLRRKTRLADLADDIGSGGQQLGAFIHPLKPAERGQLLQSLQRYYPQVTKIHTSILRGGAVKLELHERYQVDTNTSGTDSSSTEDMVTEARHINDGMLRLLAILAQQFSPYEFVLFDEIENGVNPEITEALVDALVHSSKQLLVTTHSPMVLNYLDDEVARQSVVLIYKRPDGVSRAVRLFDVPMAEERLECLSPGESMLDLSLTRVAKAAEQMLTSSREED